MNDYDRIYAILKNVKAPNTDFITSVKGECLFIQAASVLPCTMTGEEKLQRGRKWYLSPHMTETEVVNTAFMAYMQFWSHELEEGFKYLGHTIYSPHLPVAVRILFSDHPMDRREE